MILNFDLKLLVVDLMSCSWTWSIGSAKCFIAGVVKLGNVRKTEETLLDFLQNV